MTSLHVWSGSIITPFGVICFIIIILVFVSDSSFSLHLLFFSYSDPSRVWYLIHIIITHLTISLIRFICFLIYLMFTVGTIGSLAHGIYYTCCISYMRAWVFDHWVFGPSFPSFLSPQHPNLRYVPCLKTTLRPWDQMSSSTASAWAGVWDLVAFYISSCSFFWEAPFWWSDSFQLCLDYLDHAFVDGWFGAACFSDLLHIWCHTGAYFHFQTRFIDPLWFAWSSPAMGYVSGWGFDLILSWLSGWLFLVSFHQAHTFWCQCDFRMGSSQAHGFSHRHFARYMSDLLYIPIGLLMS